MSAVPCAELHALAEDLHGDAAASMAEAADRGSSWPGFTDKVAEAAQSERKADAVEAQIAADC